MAHHISIKNQANLITVTVLLQDIELLKWSAKCAQLFISSGLLIDCKSAIASTFATFICTEATSAGSGLSLLNPEHGSATWDGSVPIEPSTTLLRVVSQEWSSIKLLFMEQ